MTTESSNKERLDEYRRVHRYIQSRQIRFTSHRHECTTECRLLNGKNDTFYCLYSGNMHICNIPGGCVGLQMIDNSYRCSITGKFFGPRYFMNKYDEDNGMTIQRDTISFSGLGWCGVEPPKPQEEKKRLTLYDMPTEKILNKEAYQILRSEKKKRKIEDDQEKHKSVINVKGRKIHLRTKRVPRDARLDTTDYNTVARQVYTSCTKETTRGMDWFLKTCNDLWLRVLTSKTWQKAPHRYSYRYHCLVVLYFVVGTEISLRDYTFPGSRPSVTLHPFSDIGSINTGTRSPYRTGVFIHCERIFQKIFKDQLYVPNKNHEPFHTIFDGINEVVRDMGR